MSGTVAQAIRLAQTSDFPACSILAAEAWPDEAGSIGQKLNREMNDQFSNYSSPPRFFVSVANNSIIGMAGYQKSMMSWDFYELTWVMVHPSQQRKSIGRAKFGTSVSSHGVPDESVEGLSTAP